MSGLLLTALLLAPGPVTVDFGTGIAEPLLVSGVHQAEAARATAGHPFFQEHDFRWIANQCAFHVPVLANRNNQLTIVMKTPRTLTLTFDERWQATVKGRDDENYTYYVFLPAGAVGDHDRILLESTATPPYQPSASSRDKRELAAAIDKVVSEAVDAPRLDAVIATKLPNAAPPEQVKRVNVGADGDEDYLVSGFYQREGFNQRSGHPFYSFATFRWFGNAWVVKLPVWPGTDNEVRMRLDGRPMILRIGDGPEQMLPAARRYISTFYIPASQIQGDTVEVHGRAIAPVAKRESDARELVATVDDFEIRPVAAMPELPEGMSSMFEIPDEPEVDRPLTDRLRGLESRPLNTDVDAYVTEARLMRCNVATIGPMNGRHFTAFATKDGIPTEGMDPTFIPRQITALHQHGIAAIGWLPFNVQDLRAPDQCEAAKKYPDYTMKYIDWPEEAAKRPADKRVGMCIVSSPWRDIHAGILKEAAALGLDGVFFDGFYLGGIPHPSVPGCVCQWCQAKFKQDTGLATPPKVDWTDPAFKRWVRWRNEQLIGTAIYYRDTMREANPTLEVTCNYNIWPFGGKDWETAIPMWSSSEYGCSQHAYTGRADMEWVMLGFKSRVSHDFNPAHSDIWRTSQPAFKYTDTDEDRARHELTMRTFMLSGLSHGVVPWHGGNIQPADAGIRIHLAIKEREDYFSHDELRHVGVVLSQNTFDFWGHIPATDNLLDYQDGILGTWLLLTEHHVPFRFVFDNQLEAGELGDYKVLLMPRTVCLTDEAAAKIKTWVAAGGKLIVTGETGTRDGWGEPRQGHALDGVAKVTLGGTPALDWLRTRDAKAEQAVIEAVTAVPAPIQVDAPRSLASVPMWSKDRQQIWLHLLNVSAFYPGGDTGFRGQGNEPVYAGDVASDAQLIQGGSVPRVIVPAEGITVKVAAKSARLAIAGVELKPDPNGVFRLPAIEVHDVLVIER